MEETKVVIDALNELGYSFKQVPVEDDAVRFDITVDQGEDLGVVALLYRVNGEAGLRLMAYVDEVSKDEPLEHLRDVLALNGDLPLGAYCLDPEEDLIYVTLNMPLEEMNADNLAFMVEALLAAQEFYFLEFYEEDLQPEAEG
jgi:hypothetical protein